MKNKIIAALIIAGVYATPIVVNASDATLGYQIVQQGTLLEQYATQAEQLQQQISLLQDAYRNSAGLPLQAWGSAQGYLNELQSLIQNTQGLTYNSSNLLGQVETQYGDGKSILPKYRDQMAGWNQNMMGQVSSVMRQYNMHSNNQIAAQNSLNNLMNASNTAQGRMQVLQAGNQIAGIMVNEIQGLQNIMMAANQAQLNQIANQTAKEQQAELKKKEFFRKAEGKY